MKTPSEIAAIKETQRAVEAAMQAVITYIQTDAAPTAEAAHGIIDTILMQYDCVSPEGHIVAGGVLATEPHEIGHGVLPKGEAIVIDIYPQSTKTGYYADMTRTICIGEPTPELQKMYDTVLAAQELAIAMVKPEVLCTDIQQAVDDFFTEAGYLTSGKGTEFVFAEGFVHGVGHGVGKAIHEIPHINVSSTDVLQTGDVIAIEPGLYYKDIGGIRIEDMLLVIESGAENLTNFSKQFNLEKIM